LNTRLPTVDALVQSRGQHLQLQWLAGREGVDRALGNSPQTPGRALVGFLNLIHPNRLQIISQHEIDYLDALEAPARQALIRELLAAKPAVIIIAEGLTPPADLLREAEATQTPLMSSTLGSIKLIGCLRHYLGDELAEKAVLHGVFMEVNGLGVLITGESGIGKSELALELITRNHRLIADDAPEFSRVGPEAVRGRCPQVLQDFLEVRGLGLLDVRAMYGDSAIKQTKDLGLIVRLQRMAAEDLPNLDRVHGSHQEQRILDVDIPQVSIPVAPGRNLAVLVEAAARNHILRRKGYNAPQAFIDRQHELLQQKTPT